MQNTDLVLVLAALGLVPLVFMGLTAFVKISTVLFITRSAIGMPAVPANLAEVTRAVDAEARAAAQPAAVTTQAVTPPPETDATLARAPLP